MSHMQFASQTVADSLVAFLLTRTMVRVVRWSSSFRCAACQNTVIQNCNNMADDVVGLLIDPDVPELRCPYCTLQLMRLLDTTVVSITSIPPFTEFDFDDDELSGSRSEASPTPPSRADERFSVTSPEKSLYRSRRYSHWTS